MSAPKFQLSHKAYTKLILHAAKYPHAPVNGILLGAASPSEGGSIVIADAIPLLHQWTSLSPMMEIGLDLVCSFATLQTKRKLTEWNRHVLTQNRWE
jgi:hypothetical protein